jgi:hypothetical protein
MHRPTWQHLTRPSTDCGRQAADQLAPAFRRASLDCNGHPINGKRIVGGNDLVHTVRFAARIGERTVNLVTQAGDRSSVDIVVGRTANDCTAMIGFVSDCNDLQ